MRSILIKSINGRKMPLVMAHMGGLSHGRPNSIQAIRNSTKYNPDIFEIDVRKSRDNILFCHHGSLPFGIIFSQILFLFRFNFIVKLLGQINTLDEILEAIPQNIIVYLDIKSGYITSDDLLKVINKYPAHQIWMAAYNLNYLKRLRAKLGENYVYVFNRPIVFLNHFLNNSKGIADIVQLFIWQWKERVVQKVNSNGIEVHLAHWFVPLSRKYIIGKKYNNIWLTYDDLRLTQTSKQLS
ncbi:MAG: hypothetical protein WC705_01760 [Candidatus Paceibacterota bacterium]|jgi:glycerophosphoryl diester phosphodiesterase